MLAIASPFALSRFAFAQSAGRGYRIGWLSTADLFREPHHLAFVLRLRELGLAEGRNLSIELKVLPSMLLRADRVIE